MWIILDLIISTIITWAGPRCVQELATISAPQNRTQGHSVLELSEEQNRKIKLDHNLFLQKWKHTWNIHMISTIFPADHRRCYQIKKLQLIYRQIFQFLVFYSILDGHWITYNIQHTTYNALSAMKIIYNIYIKCFYLCLQGHSQKRNQFDRCL